MISNRNHCAAGHVLIADRLITSKRGNVTCRLCVEHYYKNRDKNLARKRIFYLKNKERIIARMRLKYDSGKNHLQKIKKAYGVSKELYETMFRLQRGCCAICRKKEGKRRLAIDHRHGNGGHVRGLLCGNCNALLGLAGDSQHILEGAIKYLQIQNIVEMPDPDEKELD